MGIHDFFLHLDLDELRALDKSRLMQAAAMKLLRQVTGGAQATKRKSGGAKAKKKSKASAGADDKEEETEALQ